MFVSQPALKQTDRRTGCIGLCPGPTLRQNGINGTMCQDRRRGHPFCDKYGGKNIEFRVQTSPLHTISRDLTVIVPAMPYTSYLRQQLLWLRSHFKCASLLHPIGTVPNLMYARRGPSHQSARSVHCQKSDSYDTCSTSQRPYDSYLFASHRQPPRATVHTIQLAQLDKDPSLKGIMHLSMTPSWLLSKQGGCFLHMNFWNLPPLDCITAHSN
jgi:hypothetical protein